MFYTFYQIHENLKHKPSKGISRFVVFEAETAFHANALANKNGMRWDTSTGIGDRWYSVSKKDAHEEPSVFGFEVDLLSDFDLELPFSKEMNGPEGYTHYLDGEIVGFWY